MSTIEPHSNESATPSLIAVCVGNTSVQLAGFADPLRASEPLGQRSCPAGDPAAALELVAAIDAELAAQNADRPRFIAIASVNLPASTDLESQIRERFTARIVRIPQDLPVPIAVAIKPEAKPGVDRLLASAAAYDVLKQACAVIDAGTAMTVNFVDGEGTFQGGVIAPGLRMALRALHEHTAGLPDLPFEHPGDAWIGKDTREAMLQGVFHGARGLVRLIIERYAEAYEGYPAVIACGGDAQTLFAGDEFVDRVVPDLVLRGIALAYRQAIAGSVHDGEAAGESS